LKVSTLERTNRRTAIVSPVRETWNRKIASRGMTGASLGTGSSVDARGTGRESKQRLSWLYAGPY
jgi:hypothetical protein